MPWNGSGTFNRIYSWVADKAAGLDISSSRMDTDTDDIASTGFGNCLTRDGQGQPSTNLPMAGFRHTGVGVGVARTDYAQLSQDQDGLLYWSTDTGSATAYAITLTPAVTALNDGQLCYFRAANTNTSTTPTFAPNGLTAHTITKVGGSALALGDIQANQECELRYNLANTRWELLNPSNVTPLAAVAMTGMVVLTVATSAPTGWLIFDDGTFGSATSGSSNSNSALNQALFTLMFNNVSDSNAPLFTSTGSGTTRAGQGTAAAAWAANCRMSLPKTLGRALGVAGAGSGLTSRALAATVGTETDTLAAGNIPSLTSSGSASAAGAGLTQIAGVTSSTITDFPANISGAGAINIPQNVSATNWTGVTSLPVSATYTNASPTAISIMQPSSFLNALVKQ